MLERRIPQDDGSEAEVVARSVVIEQTEDGTRVELADPTPIEALLVLALIAGVVAVVWIRRRRPA